MIQRVQTLWLIGVILVAGLSYFVPFAKEIVDGVTEAKELSIKDFYLVLFFILDIIICAGIAIFSYKILNRQKLFTLIGIFICIACFGIMYYYSEMEVQNRAIRLGAIVPLACACFYFMAFRAIRKDEQVLKNLDRFR